MFSPPRGNLPSPPDSPGKRRRHLRESDETDGLMLIEQWLVRADPFRTTTHPTPPPYPLCVDAGPAPLVQKLQPHIPAIENILRNFGFTDRPVVTLHDIWKPDYPGWENRVTFLRVILQNDQKIPSSPALGRAKDRIYDHLLSCGVRGVHVEIVHMSHCFRPSFFPIKHNDPMVGIYEAARPQLLTALRNTVGSNWRLMSLFRVGRNEAKAKHAVVIMVDAQSFCDWSDVESRIQGSLRNAGNARIEIEFVPGRVSFLNPPDKEPGNFVTRLDTDGVARPRMGHSIGVKGEGNAGTLGGFVTISINGQPRKGLLTNYHVVRQLTSPQLHLIDRFGTSPWGPDNSRAEIVYLAEPDARKTLEFIRDHLKSGREELIATKQEQEAREVAGVRPSVGLARKIKLAEEHLSVLAKQENLVKTMPKILGCVLASSGLSVIDNKILDWAFVELSSQAEKVFCRNTMPSIPPEMHPNFLQAESFPAAPEGTHLTELGEIRKSAWYIKVGRNPGIGNGVTTGICHGLWAEIQWPGKHSTRYDAQGNPVVMAEGITREWIILSKTSRGASFEQTPFCESGDSGSLIIDSTARVCGILFGEAFSLSGPPALDGAYGSMALVTSMPDLLNSIREKTTRKDAQGRPIGSGGQLDLP